MPVFRAGESQARAAAALLRAPFYPVSHQEGHIRAALVDSGVDAQQPFLALHLSGGTTELLACEDGRLTLLGGSLDLHAGQLIDRIGVRMGLAFPAGPELEHLAMRGAAQGRIGVSIKGASCNMAGAENKAVRWLENGELAREDVACEVFDFLSRSIERMIEAACGQTQARQALLAGGVTVGVLGNGTDVAYPPSSRALYEDVAASGALVSEYPPGTEPARRHFPARNRIISGLCVATLVVEAPGKSGALITAETALEQGRDVFAVPGPIDAPGSLGCNRLIRDGAGLAAEAADILREYEGRFPGKITCGDTGEEPPAAGYHRPQQAEARAVPPPFSISRGGITLTDDQIALLRILPDEEPALMDDLIEESGIPTRRVLSALTVLEIDDLVTQHSGKRYTRRVTLTE